MRTTITIDDQIFLEAKKLAVESEKTFSDVIEDALRSSLARRGAKKTAVVSLVTMKGTGLRHGVDLDDGQSLLDIMGR